MGKIVELEIEDLAYNGKSVGYVDGKVTFVKGGLPGERVEARIIKSKRNYNQAKLLKILNKAPERIDPVCRHYDICGGCIWQDLEYDRQLYYKRQQVIACLEHIGKINDVPVGEICPSPDIYFYRNKMEYSFHTASEEKSKNRFVLGLHERGRFDCIFDIEECHLQSATSNKIVNCLRECICDLDIPAYDLIRHEGFLRFVIIREGKNTGQVLLNLVSGEGEFSTKEQLTKILIDKIPELTTIVWTVNPTISNVATGEIREVLFGPGYIEEEILGHKFRISPGSFFQTNSRQTEALYKKAIELADLSSDETILDLYCGTGTIGICAAKEAKEVVGIEIVEEAIESANINTEINDIDNCRFYSGDVRKILLLDELKDIEFRTIFVDPPRAGMHPKALKRLIEADADKIVYISCNPATFARDVDELIGKGYVLEKVIPFDMFPHTMHIELVSRFTKMP